MRHQKKRHKLGRNASHRKATLISLGNALITHKRVTTTVPKAKALRTFIEPILTRAKDDSQHNRRQVFRRLRDKQSVTALFTEVAGKIGERPGGYTRVVKIGRRAGDAAPMAVVELVDYNASDAAASAGPAKTRRTRRGRRRGGASASPARPEVVDTGVKDVAEDAAGESAAASAEEAIEAASDSEAVGAPESSVPDPEASSDPSAAPDDAAESAAEASSDPSAAPDAAAEADKEKA